METDTTLRTLLTGIELLMIIPPIAYIWVYVLLPWSTIKTGQPLNCVPCFSFWLFILVAIFVSPELIIFAPTAYIIGAILDRYVV